MSETVLVLAQYFTISNKMRQLIGLCRADSNQFTLTFYFELATVPGPVQCHADKKDVQYTFQKNGDCKKAPCFYHQK